MGVWRPFENDEEKSKFGQVHKKYELGRERGMNEGELASKVTKGR